MGLSPSERILCAGSKANSSLPALVIRPSLSYSNFSCFYIAELLTLCSIVSLSNISFSLFLLERK